MGMCTIVWNSHVIIAMGLLLHFSFCVGQLAKESEATTQQLQSELIEAQSNAKKLSDEVHAATEHIRTLRAEQEVTLVQIIEWL